MNNDKKTARIAGLLYLVLIVCGVFAEFFVRSEIYVPDDGAATANNILTSEGLYRVGFVCDIIMLMAYFFLPLVLYLLLKSVNKNHALLMVLCVLIAVSILGVNMLNHLAPLLILNGAGYWDAFDSEQLNGLVMFFLKMHGRGYLVAQIFFGLWLLPLGYLVYKSRLFPGILGIVLMIGSIGYLIDFFVFFLFPEISGIISEIATLPADLGEFSLCLWLLIKGVRDVSPGVSAV